MESLAARALSMVGMLAVILLLAVQFEGHHCAFQALCTRGEYRIHESTCTMCVCGSCMDFAPSLYCVAFIHLARGKK